MREQVDHTYPTCKEGAEQMITDGIENIDPNTSDETEPLTTIVATKCSQCLLYPINTTFSIPIYAMIVLGDSSRE